MLTSTLSENFGFCAIFNLNFSCFKSLAISWIIGFVAIGQWCTLKRVFFVQMVLHLEYFEWMSWCCYFEAFTVTTFEILFLKPCRSFLQTQRAGIGKRLWGQTKRSNFVLTKLKQLACQSVLYHSSDNCDEM